MKTALITAAVVLIAVAIGVVIGLTVNNKTSGQPSPSSTSQIMYCYIKTQIPGEPLVWIKLAGDQGFCGDAVGALRNTIPANSQTTLVGSAPANAVTVASSGGVVVLAKPHTVSPDLAHQIQIGLQRAGQ